MPSFMAAPQGPRKLVIGKRFVKGKRGIGDSRGWSTSNSASGGDPIDDFVHQRFPLEPQLSHVHARRLQRLARERDFRLAAPLGVALHVSSLLTEAETALLQVFVGGLMVPLPAADRERRQLCSFLGI